MSSEVSIGAVGAALIGALISLVGLVISKESKVSEFRQAWIDALRSSLATFLTNVNAVVDANLVDFENNKDRFKELQPFLNNLNESYYSIALRVNSNEELSKDLQKSMVGLSKLVQDSPIDMSAFEKLRVDFIRASAALLKAEWNRVKEGEVVYRWTRYVASGAVVAFIAVGAAMLIWGESSQSGQKEQSASQVAAVKSLPVKAPVPAASQPSPVATVKRPEETPSRGATSNPDLTPPAENAH